jgi:uncharacterized protein YfeS
MQVSVIRQTYDSLGGIAVHSFIGDLLTLRLGNYGSGLKEIDITVCFRHAKRNPKPTLEDLFDDFHKYVKTLPRTTFYRRAKRIEINFLSDNFTAEYEESGRKPTLKDYQTAAKEIAALLPLIQKKLKPKDKFDIQSFIADAEAILSSKVKSLDEWKKIGRQADKLIQAENAAKDPWELLEIDWDKFHRNARKILDDPFFWDCADDFAPHGNDTGADVLEAFRRWHRKNPRTLPIKFLDDLMKRWDIEPVEWLETGRTTVLKLNKQDPISMQVSNQAAVGLAFAVIKMRPKCPQDAIERASAALDRMEILYSRSKMGRKQKAEWKTALTKMREKLDAMPAK